jgi:hypothetical protein
MVAAALSMIPHAIPHARSRAVPRPLPDQRRAETCTGPMRAARAQRRLALILSSAAAPGQSSVSVSRLSGVLVVPR